MTEPTGRLTAEQARTLTGNHWLSRREAAKYLGMSEQTLANNRATGPRLYKFFGQVRHKLSDLDLWAQQRLAN